MDNLRQCISGKKICVTGARGRIGQCVVEKLITLGADVVALSEHSLEKYSKDVKWIRGSILCEDDLIKAFHRCNIVIHLAALTNAPDSYQFPLKYFEVNGLGTAKVLDACRQADIERLVYASTGHVYGVPTYLPIDELHPKNPLSPYAASKLAGEIAVEAYTKAFALHGFVARISNVYGSQMGISTVIGRALDQAVLGFPIQLNDLSPIRDFIYIDDVVQSLIHLAFASSSISYTAVNVSSGNGISIYDMAKIVAEVSISVGIGKGEIIHPAVSCRDQVSEIVMDNSQLIKLTGYRPNTSLEEGIKKDMKILLERKGFC